MANSKIGQYQLEFNLDGWVTPTRSHFLRMNVDAINDPSAGANPTAVDIGLKNGLSDDLKAVADEAWSYLRLAYPTTISANSFTLWKWTTDTVRDFISAGSLATPTGTVGTPQLAAQVTLTFRAAAGGIAKLVFIESNQSGDTRSALVPNPAGTAMQRIADYLLSARSPMQALDNTFVVAALRDSRGQNEAIWRKLYRST